MNILFATPTPPLRTKPRPHYFLRGLARNGHRIHLLTQVTTHSQREALADAPGWMDVVDCCASVTTVLASTSAAYLRCARSLQPGTPLRVAYCEAPSFIDRAREILERTPIDLVHVDRERLARLFRFHRGPKVLDATDSISVYNEQLQRYGRGVNRLIAALEAPRMKDYERDMAAGYSACIVSAPSDGRALQNITGDVPIRVIPNGVDERLLDAERREAEDELLFVGNMSYPPNVDAVRWFVRRVLPVVQAEVPSVRLTIVGSRPHRSVRELERVRGVTVTGQVSDVLPFLMRATALVSPIRIGGGFPNKVAEAMAAGLPVISTPAGCEGLSGVVPGRHLLSASTAQEFGAATVRVLSYPAFRRRVGQAGQVYLRSGYSWERSVGQLQSEYRRACAERIGA